MARDYANIQTSIWGNPDVRALPLEHQGLYLQLWTHPDVEYSGVMDWRPGRSVAPLSAGSTADSIRALIPLLEEKLFVVVDEDTEELLLRSYHRHDGLMKNPSTAVSMTKDYAAVGSNMLRGVIVHELLRLREEFPEWKCWSLAQVQSILKHPSIDPRSLHPTPQLAPSPAPLGAPTDAPHLAPKPTPLGAPPPTATATTTEASLLPSEEQEASPLRELPLPKSWVPSAEHYALAAQLGVDVVREAEVFRDHAFTHDRRAKRWNGAFTTWLKKARPTLAAGAQVEPGNEWMLR